MSKQENVNDTFEHVYLPYIIKWGKLTNWTAVVLSLSPAMVLALIFDLMPPFSAIINGFVLIASAVGVVWFVEPISYFPIIGVAGTYMAFISGNIGNLRIPCAMVAQKVAGVEPGTNEGAIIATLGMAVSIVVNTVILTAGVIAGASVLQQLPKSIVDALQFLLPALFGAIFTQFAIQRLKLAPIVLVLCILLVVGVKQGIVPGFLSTLISVFLSIAIAVLMYKKGFLK
ncbi:hypothetical protein C4J81_11320 [Deltaproteobacteria bacterium Smac51]|nr:hypothetical protein C4J81_11320 [Deltaproteobacteria bacterium Smac51]